MRQDATEGSRPKLGRPAKTRPHSSSDEQQLTVTDSTVLPEVVASDDKPVDPDPNRPSSSVKTKTNNFRAATISDSEN